MSPHNPFQTHDLRAPATCFGLQPSPRSFSRSRPTILCATMVRRRFRVRKPRRVVSTAIAPLARINSAGPLPPTADGAIPAKILGTYFFLWCSRHPAQRPPHAVSPTPTTRLWPPPTPTNSLQRWTPISSFLFLRTRAASTTADRPVYRTNISIATPRMTGIFSTGHPQPAFGRVAPRTCLRGHLAKIAALVSNERGSSLCSRMYIQFMSPHIV